MRKLTTARQVVDVLGGHEAVCKLTGAESKAVYHWTGQSKMFPARLHALMLRALKKRGAQAPDWLWNQTGCERDAA
jgi:hypothetical protein